MTETAGIYCRLSVAKIGDTTKVEDQERICRELCERLGWTVAAVFTDNNRSAWQRDRKRPGWDAMLQSVADGRLSAIVVYHGDRLARQPFDLEQLLNITYGKGIKLASPTGRKDLSNEDDLFILRIEVAAQCRESASTSRRKKAGFARMARDGRAPIPGGRSGRGFGYEKDGRTPHPVEAPAVREAAQRILAGERVATICRDFHARGIMAVSGRPLNYQSLKRILTRPRIAGLLADETPGSWEPVLGREPWELVRAVLDGRAPHKGGAPKYLLSGIATCWACKKPVQRQQSASAVGYGCVTPGCRKVHRNMRHLDAYVSRRTWIRLSRHDNPAAHVSDRPGLALEIATLAEARADIAAKIADPAQPHVDLLLQRLDALERRLAVLRETTVADSARLRLLATHRGVAWEEFLALPLGTRRALISALFRIEILASTHRGPGFHREDVRMIAL